MRLKVVLEERDDGGFKVFVPSLPDCICDGKNPDEAFRKVQSAILRYYGIEEIHPSDESQTKDMLN